MNTVFFNIPPQIAMSEMVGNLPSSNTLFNASTRGEFAHLVTTRTHYLHHLPSLSDWVGNLMQEQYSMSEDVILASLEPNHMMIGIFGS